MNSLFHSFFKKKSFPSWSRFYQRRTVDRNPTLNQKGQIALEYILIVVCVVGFAALLVKNFVGREANDAGFMIVWWENAIQAIGADLADEVAVSDQDVQGVEQQ